MSYASFEELDVYQLAERVADRCYDIVTSWRSLDQETVGKQLIRAADSIGANIAEGHGRYHYGDQLRFLYYARGSLAETRHWMRRVRRRKLLPVEAAYKALTVLEELAKKLNAYISFVRRKRKNSGKQSKDALAEQSPYYEAETVSPYDIDDIDDPYWLSDVEEKEDAFSPESTPNQLENPSSKLPDPHSWDTPMNYSTSQPFNLCAARDFVYANGVLWERRLFGHLFEGRPVEPVLAAFKAYKNADNGFGNALEHDVRCPDSHPLALEFLLTVLLRAGIEPGDQSTN